MTEEIWLSFVFLLVAAIYASVGQAGASGYLAAMGFFELPPSAMKTTALSLNLLVSAIGTLQFWRSGLLSWRTFYPFGVLGVPFSLIGGAVQLPSDAYYPAVGAILLLSAALMFRSARSGRLARPAPPLHPPFLPALLAGGIIGFVSGTTGTGGGVFLAPVIVSRNWVTMRQTAAVTAAYNLMNSAAALVGAYGIRDSAPTGLPLWLVAVGVGGALGAFVGSRHLPDRAMRYVLAFILFVSGAKFLLG